MQRHSGLDPTSMHTTLPPEIMLVGAVLRQAVVDARLDQPSQTSAHAQRQAIDFLLDDESITFWAHLIDANPEGIAQTLRKAAGLL